MGVVEIVLLGVALAMDAFAVTISDTFAYPDSSRVRFFLLPVAFGLFQGIMPVFGYVLGGVVGSIIETYSGIVTLVILGLIGGNMIKEGVEALRGEGEESEGQVLAKVTVPVILAQAVATSIDAFAVGVSLRAEGADIVFSAVVIALTTFLICLVALGIGRRFGTVLGDKAQVVGGAVLIGIGIKAMFF